jgi:RNA polymerase sigma-70 factor (ECF subfamily)
MTDLRNRFEQEALPHLEAAYNLARWLSKSATDAQDIVQEALLLAYRNFSSQRGTNTRAWLLAIVRNSFLSGARRHGPVARVTESLADAPDGAPVPAALVSTEDPARSAEDAERTRAVDAVLARLPDEHREILVLRELEGFSYQEIAGITGLAIGTVMSRLSRARAAFRADWIRANGGGVDGLS